MSNSLRPLSIIDYAINPTIELDVESPLGRAILSERWYNMSWSHQQYWVFRLSQGVIHCNTTVCASRRQVELEIEVHPGDYIVFCICLDDFDRFIN